MQKAVVTFLVCVMSISDFVLADNIQGIDIDFVNVGNAGNDPDIRVMQDGTTGYGSVGYNYRIGKYEVTNAQWNAFTGAAGSPTGNPFNAYDLNAAYTGAQQPTNNISWYEAAQFCNYLTSGNKSKGVYQFSGDTASPGDFLGIDRIAAQSIYGTIYCLPTEDEWYKAAYHKNDGKTGNYWLYPTQSDNIPSNDLINPDSGNNACFYQNGYTIGSPGYMTSVGEFENSDSAYGTFDQGGNVWEWNETLVNGSVRGLRGGSFNYEDFSLASTFRNYAFPYEEYDTIQGFRVVSIPEPAILSLLIFGGIGLTRKYKRK